MAVLKTYLQLQVVNISYFVVITENTGLSHYSAAEQDLRQL